MVPDGFIQETLRTFALLFPERDPATIKWFNGTLSSLKLDSQIIKCGHLRASDRQFYVLARPAGCFKASLRPSTSQHFLSVVVRQAKWCAIVHLLGRHLHLGCDNLLWPIAEY
jgi:hypothetical protein